MKAFWVACFVAVPICLFGQFLPQKPKVFAYNYLRYFETVNKYVEDLGQSGGLLNKQYESSFGSPVLTYWMGNQFGNAQMQWLSSSTTKTLGQGRIGTVYFFDLNGNLSNARNFVDVKVGTKRRFRLVYSSR